MIEFKLSRTQPKRCGIRRSAIVDDEEGNWNVPIASCRHIHATLTVSSMTDLDCRPLSIGVSPFAHEQEEASQGECISSVPVEAIFRLLDHVGMGNYLQGQFFGKDFAKDVGWSLSIIQVEGGILRQGLSEALAELKIGLAIQQNATGIKI